MVLRVSSSSGPYISTGYIFSPYCTLFADNHERRSVPGRQGDGYFSGWKIIRRLPQALKWAALRLRTIIIISSDEEGALRQPRRKGNAKGKSTRYGAEGEGEPSPGYRLARIHERVGSKRADVVVNIFTGSLTSRRGRRSPFGISRRLILPPSPGP